MDSVNPRPPYLPPAIPEDLAPRIQRYTFQQEIGEREILWEKELIIFILIDYIDMLL